VTLRFDQRISFEASYIPFPRTPEERENDGDPRRSIAERYPSREEYLGRYREAVNEVIQQKYVLPEDRDALLKRGEEEWDQATQHRSRLGDFFPHSVT
jgi:Alpha/beta hydrolase domain